MKSLAFAALATLALSSSAFAADLAPRAVEPIAPAYLPFSWTGFYIGLNAGGAFGDVHGDYTGVTGKADITQFTGGALAGANYQYGSWVFGIEGDINYLGFKKEFSPGAAGGGLVAKASVDAYGTVRARAGYAIDRWLPYVTGGVAIGNVKIDEHVFTESKSETQVGFAVGGGLEYAFNDHWTARAEYLYVDLGKKDFAFVGGAPFPYDVKTSFSVVRAAIAYKF